MCDEGNAIIVGDLKLVSIGQAWYNFSNGWYSPPGLELTAQYSAPYVIDCLQSRSSFVYGDAVGARECIGG